MGTLSKKYKHSKSQCSIYFTIYAQGFGNPPPVYIIFGAVYGSSKLYNTILRKNDTVSS